MADSLQTSFSLTISRIKNDLQLEYVPQDLHELIDENIAEVQIMSRCQQERCHYLYWQFTDIHDVMLHH